MSFENSVSPSGILAAPTATPPTPLQDILASQPGQVAFQGADGSRIQATTPLTPVVTLQEVTKVVLERADKIDAVLAEQGEQLDRAKILEDLTVPVPTVAAVEEAKQDASDVVNGTYVSQETFVELKNGINDSFGEIAGILLDLTARFDRLDERLEAFNKRGGHKI